MGKVLSVASRKAKRFNVENRAHKIISMDKPVPAPKHPATLREMEQLLKDHADALETIKSKDAKLDEHLKKVYVTSTDVDMNKFGKPSDRKMLPVSRGYSHDTEFGYEEPESIPTGRFTLKQALRVLTDKHADPQSITAENIANKLNIPQNDAVHLINYFSTFNIYMPETTPQLSIGDKAKRVLIRQTSPIKVETIESSQNPQPVQLESSTKNRPD